MGGQAGRQTNRKGHDTLTDKAYMFRYTVTPTANPTPKHTHHTTHKHTQNEGWKKKRESDRHSK